MTLDEAHYSPSYRNLLITVYINGWMASTYRAYHAAQREDWSEFNWAFNCAIVDLRNVLTLLQGWSNSLDRRAWNLEQVEAPRMTDAEIFDACYRELVRRWGPAPYEP